MRGLTPCGRRTSTGRTNSQAVLQVLPPGGPSIRINGQLAVGTVPAIVTAQLTIAGGFTNGFIFYTLDGSVPTASSPLNAGPITLTNSATIRAMSMSADFSQSSVSPAVTLQIIPAVQSAHICGGEWKHKRQPNQRSCTRATVW